MRRLSAAQLRSYDNLQREMEEDLKYFDTGEYLEPWQRLPVDPTIEHVVTIVDANNHSHMTCSCGLDREVRYSSHARDDGRWHADSVAKAKREHGLDDTPVAQIERSHNEQGPQFRWWCHCIRGLGPWVSSEEVARELSILHLDACRKESAAVWARAEQREKSERQKNRRR